MKKKKDNPILKRLGELGVNNEIESEEREEVRVGLDIVLEKAKKKANEIDLKIKECISIREELVGLDFCEPGTPIGTATKRAKIIASFRNKLDSLAKKKAEIERAINTVVAQTKMEEYEEEK